MLGFFSFLSFFNIPSFHLSFSPLYSLFFNPSSFLIILFSFLIITQLKNAMSIVIQPIQCTCVHQATEVNATNQTVH